MHTQKWLRIVITLAVISQVLISYGAPGRVAAAEGTPIGHELNVDKPLPSILTLPNSGAANRALNIPEGPFADTTLSVSILSSPWAILDANDPQGLHGRGSTSLCG